MAFAIVGEIDLFVHGDKSIRQFIGASSVKLEPKVIEATAKTRENGMNCRHKVNKHTESVCSR